MRKVLQVAKFYPPERGGIERVVHAYATGLARSGWQPTVLCFSPSGDSDGDEQGVRVRRLAPRISAGRAPFSLQFVRELKRLAREADIVHLHEPFPAATLAPLLLPRDKPVVISWHGDVQALRLIRPLYFSAQRIAAKRARALIVSEGEIARQSKVIGAMTGKHQVIPFGFDLSRFSSSAANTAQRAAISWPAGKPFVFSVGRLVPYKGFDVLIRAIAGTPYNLVIAGNGPLLHELSRLADEIARPGQVSFAGDVTDEELAAWHHASSVFVLPSVSAAETFGIAQVEAMAAGKPVINTRLPTGVPTVSLHGLTGLTVAPGVASELSTAIDTIMSSPELAEKFGAAARMRANSEYGAERMMQRLIALYETILA